MKIREFIDKCIETLRANGDCVVYDGNGTMMIDTNHLPLLNYMSGKLYRDQRRSGVLIASGQQLRDEIGSNYTDIANAAWGGIRCSRRCKWIRRLLSRAFGLPRFRRREPESHKRNRYRPEPLPRPVRGTMTGRTTLSPPVAQWVPTGPSATDEAVRRQLEERASRPIITQERITELWDETMLRINRASQRRILEQFYTAWPECAPNGRQQLSP